MSLDPQTCQQQFARHLADEAAVLRVLEEQLRREHELLTANDLDGLDAVSAARQQSIAKLLRIQDERGNLCRARNLGNDMAGLAELLAWCDPQGSLKDAQAECAEQARRCREQNERNGALVTARLNHVGGMLGMIDGEPGQRVYQPRATAAAPAFAAAGRLLSTSA